MLNPQMYNFAKLPTYMFPQNLFDIFSRAFLI